MSGRREVVKGGEKVKRKSNNPAGRPRMSADEKLVLVTTRMRPGDIEKLVAVARRRGVPTGSLMRDMMHAFLVGLEEPGPFWRAGVESLFVDLGFGEIEADGRRTRG